MDTNFAFVGLQVLANKQDVAGCMSPVDISEVYRKIEMYKICFKSKF